MSRVISILSGLSFLTILLVITLMSFGVIHPFNGVPYLVLSCSGFLTLFSLGLFVRRNKLPKLYSLLIGILLILPLIVPIIAVFNSEAITHFWKLFIGGSIFQIGTGIFILLGGYAYKGGALFYRVTNASNYIVFLLLSLILIFDVGALMNRYLFIVLGVLISFLSLLLLFIPRQRIA